MAIQNDFFDAQVYGIYMATRDLLGERGEELVALSGRYVFRRLRASLDLEGKNPVEVVRVLADYLEAAGYYERAEITEIGANEFYYDMYGVSIFGCVKDLEREGGVLPHFSTALIFAALEEICGMKAELAHLEMSGAGADFHGREKWVLKSL